MHFLFILPPLAGESYTGHKQSQSIRELGNLNNSLLKIRGARGIMQNATDLEQSSNKELEITPFIPLILRGR
jgi:hypothetical protein